MNNTIIDLQLPLSPEQAGSLKLGDLVTVSGLMFTGRSRFHIRAVNEDIVPPLDFSTVNCFFHTGPVMRKTAQGWETVSIEPTSSIRFEKYSGQVIRKLGIRTLIGKTTMGPDTAAALKEVSGVHLSKIGICGNMLSNQVHKVIDVFFLDELGKTEATWLIEVEQFGPFFVDIDAHGRNYFSELKQLTESRKPEAYQNLHISADFEYTDVNG